jgi:uncharacterized protein YggU (UPF0235/DUF167 family)
VGADHYPGAVDSGALIRSARLKLRVAARPSELQPNERPRAQLRNWLRVAECEIATESGAYTREKNLLLRNVALEQSQFRKLLAPMLRTR